MTSYPFQNLVFEGGGVKGIAYLGALQVLDEKNILKQIRRIGGTSAGAINAVLLALGYTLDEMQEILTGLDFHNFMDSSWGIIRDTDRLLTKFGWYKGDFFRKWMGQLIEKKTGNPHSTFNDFAQHDFPALYLVGTNLSTGFSEVFSVEHTPRMPVADVQRPDNSSPYVYNRETLGFRLDTREEIAMFRDSAEPPHHKIDDFFDYGKSLIHAVLNVQSNQHIHSDDWHRTVYIDTLGVETTDFDISNEKKKALFKQGIASTKHYFDWFDKADPADMPVNRPENR